MRLKTFTLCALAVGILPACSSVEATWEPPTPPAPNPQVTALMPQGAYTVLGGLVMSGEPVYTLEGFVDFGTALDGTECSTEYDVTDVRPDTTATLTVSRTLRAPGGPSWSADVSAHDPTISNLPVEWRDNSDPEAAGLPFLFTPSIIASDVSPGVVEGAGNDHICAIGVMPRFMRLADDEPGSESAAGTSRLVFDASRADQTVRAARGRWVEKFVTTAGLTGAAYDTAAQAFFEVSVPSFQTLIKDTIIEIRALDEGGFEIVQLRDGKPILTLSFTPAEPRTITAPSAVPYFDRIAAREMDEDSAALLDEVLRME
jgi:hypothetical protein